MKPSLIEPYQLWFYNIKNIQDNGEEVDKLRPIIILDPGYNLDDVNEDDFDLNEFYIDFIPGTSKINKYRIDPGSFTINYPDVRRVGLSRPTTFRATTVKKTSDYNDITASQLLENGIFKGYLPYDMQKELISDIEKTTKSQRIKLYKAYNYKLDRNHFKEELEHSDKVVNVDSLGNELTNEQVEFFKQSKIRESGKLIPMWHGTDVDFKEFRGTINWFSKDKSYSEMFATWLNTTPIYYNVYLNCKNPFDCGNTSVRVYDLMPIKPYKLSKESIDLCDRLGISKEDFSILADKAVEEMENGNGYAMKLHAITRMTEFVNVVKSKGFDSILTIEEGHECVGVFNSNDIKDVNNIHPTSSKNINEYLSKKYENENYAKLNDSMSNLDAFYILKDID